MGTDTRPDLAPRLHSLLAKLASVRHPQNATHKTIIPHGLDYRLNCDSRLARSGRQADQAATTCIARRVATKHFAHVAHNNLLKAMELREPISAFDFKKRLDTAFVLAGPLG